MCWVCGVLTGLTGLSGWNGLSVLGMRCFNWFKCVEWFKVRMRYSNHTKEERFK